MRDFAIEAVRGAVTIPVVGVGSATYHVAYQLADKYGVVAQHEKSVPSLKRRIQLIGCYDRMTSMRVLGMTLPQMLAGNDETERRFVEIARHQIDIEGAELIVASCGGDMFFALGFGSRKRIEQRLGVPVLEGSGIAIKTLEMLVNLELTQSKKTYPSQAVAEGDA